MPEASHALERIVPTERDRLLVVAPHPDDEAIGAGLLLQHAVAASAQVRVVVVTHGDAFGYTASPAGAGRAPRARRVRLGVRRSHESLRAMARLGVPPSAMTFLGYPDRGLWALWSQHWRRSNPYRSPFTYVDHCPYADVLTPEAPYAGEQLLADLMAILAEFRPTLLVYPHPKDAHGDHSACSAFVTCALEEVARGGGQWARACRRLLYLVHRGGWPQPRGLDRTRVLAPPASLIQLGEVWDEVVGGPVQVAQKQAAIAMYRSQFPIIGRFLLSFVARNEVFLRPRDPVVESPPGGPPLLGKGSGWTFPPVIVDPVSDSLTRQFGRAADIASVHAVRTGSGLMFRIGLARRPASDVEYRVSLFPCPRSDGIHLRLRPPYRAAQWIGGVWRHVREVVVRPTADALEFAMPADFAAAGEGLFLAVETRVRGICVDRTGLQFVRISTQAPQDGPFTYAVASAADLSTCAQIFSEVFRASIERQFGYVPPQRIIRQVFRLCYDAEPSALLVALRDGRVQGYVYAPSSLRNLWRTALLRGHLLRWLSAWGSGRLRLGLAPLRVMLLDKFHFVRASIGGDFAAEARILSLAVAPAHQGQGIGSALVRHALERFRELGAGRVRLEVRPWNEPAMRLYEKLGFEPVGTTRDTLGEWVIMLAEV